MAAVTRRDVEAVEAVISEDFEFESTFAASEGRVFRGPTAIRDYFAAVDEAFEEIRIELVDVLGEDEGRVALRARVNARGRGSGLEINHVYGQVWTVADGTVVHVASYLDPDEARRSVGLA